ncbi:MAG: hypothetical protein AAGA18_06745 [Verrucomicrobiota bacterium]
MKSRLFLVGLLLLLLFGIIEFFSLSFESGDIYPEYSSFRSDLKGTRVLFDSLQAVNISAERNFIKLGSYMPGYEGSCVIVCGVHENNFDMIPENLFQELEARISKGWRLIVTLPGGDYRISSQEKNEEQPNQDDSRKDQTEEVSHTGSFQEGEKKLNGRDEIQRKESNNKRDSRPTLYERNLSVWLEWNAAIKNLPTKALPDEEQNFLVSKLSQSYKLKTSSESIALPQEIAWYSNRYFDLMTEGEEESVEVRDLWNIVYEIEGYPVVIERPIGSGSVVLASDSYFLSNEALANERNVNLILWIMDNKEQVIFDEVHHGVQRTLGIFNLFERFRVEGFLLGVMIVFVLFLWKRMTSLVVQDERFYGWQVENIVSGRDAISGLVHLLKRNIARKDLLNVCVREWLMTASVCRKGKDIVGGKRDISQDVNEELFKLAKLGKNSKSLKGIADEDLKECYNQIKKKVAIKV